MQKLKNYGKCLLNTIILDMSRMLWFRKNGSYENQSEERTTFWENIRSMDKNLSYLLYRLALE